MAPLFRIGTQAKQFLAIFLSACLISTSGNLAEAVKLTSARSSASSFRPQIDLNPPGALGYLVDYFGANSAPSDKQKLVILIQDLHVNYGVQRNIAALLDFFAKKLPVKPTTLGSSLPYTLAVEGASGPIDISVMALFPDQKIKQKALDYLMHEGELTGMEYFAAMRGVPNLLVGVEDGRYYNIHRELFRKTIENRIQLVHMLRGIQADIKAIGPNVYSKDLRSFQEKLDAFDEGRLGIQELTAWLAAEAQPMGIDVSGLRNPRANDHLVDAIESLAFILKIQKATTQEERDLVQVEHDLAILIKVANLQATEQEVRSFSPRLGQFVVLCHSLLKSHGLNALDEVKIRELISTSVDYYVMALMRNRPMVDNTLALLGVPKDDQSKPAINHGRGNRNRQPRKGLSPTPTERHFPDTAVLVAGGFHTKAITQLLRQRNVSYLVITPNVDKIAFSDNDLYVKRLKGEVLTEEQVITGPLRRSSSSSDLAASLFHRSSGLAVGVGLVTASVFLTSALVASAHGVDLSSYLPQFIQTNLLSMMHLQGVPEWIGHIHRLLPAGATGAASLATIPLIAAPASRGDIVTRRAKPQDTMSNAKSGETPLSNAATQLSLSGRPKSDFDFPSAFTTKPGSNLVDWLAEAQRRAIKSTPGISRGGLISITGSVAYANWHRAGDIDARIYFDTNNSYSDQDRQKINSLIHRTLIELEKLAGDYGLLIEHKDNSLVLVDRQNTKHRLELELSYSTFKELDVLEPLFGGFNPSASYFATPEATQSLDHVLGSLRLRRISLFAKNLYYTLYNAVGNMGTKTRAYGRLAVLSMLIEETYRALGLSYEGPKSADFVKLRRTGRGPEPTSYLKSDYFPPPSIFDDRQNSRADLLQNGFEKLVIQQRDSMRKTLAGHMAFDFGGLVRELAAMGVPESTTHEAIDELQSGFAVPFGFEGTAGQAQLESLKTDFAVLINGKLDEYRRGLTDSPEMVIYEIGLGRKPTETSAIINAFYDSLREIIGEDAAKGWTVRLIGIDSNKKSIETATAELQLLETQLKERGFNNFSVHFEQANALDENRLRTIREDVGHGKRADYIFHRNVTYANAFAPRDMLDVNHITSEDRSNLKAALNIYIQLQNLINVFGKPGGRYITEPVPTALRENRKHLVVPGAHIVNDGNFTGTGLYELADPSEMPNTTFKAFLIGIEESGQTDQRAPKGQMGWLSGVRQKSPAVANSIETAIITALWLAGISLGIHSALLLVFVGSIFSVLHIGRVTYANGKSESYGLKHFIPLALAGVLFALPFAALPLDPSLSLLAIAKLSAIGALASHLLHFGIYNPHLTRWWSKLPMATMAPNGNAQSGFVIPGTRPQGQGYTLSIDLPANEQKYQLQQDKRAKSIDYFHETMGIVDSRSIEMPRTYQEVKEIVDVLLEAAGLDPNYFIFHLLDTEETNAFIVRHSNHLFLNIGLVKYLIDKGGNRDSLAFVLAHEITHIAQNRDDFDHGKAGFPKDFKDLPTTFVDNYADEYDADWRALKLMDKVYEMTNGRIGFAINQATFLFQHLDQDLEEDARRNPDRPWWEKIQTKFGTHPQIKERIRKFEHLMNSLYWRGYFKKPTPFSNDLVQEIQAGTRRYRFKRGAQTLRSMNEFRALLNEATSIEELEYLVAYAFERVRTYQANFDFNQAFLLADQKGDELVAKSPELLPYYFFIFSALARYTGFSDIGYEEHKSATKQHLAQLTLPQLERLLEVQLPPILESDTKSSYFDYKYWFYGYRKAPEGSRTRGRETLENFVEIWVDSIMEEISKRAGRQQMRPEEVLALRDILEQQRQRVKQVRPRLMEASNVGGMFPANRDLFHVHNNDIAWFLWKAIQANPSLHATYIPQLVEILKVLSFNKENWGGFRQSGSLLLKSTRAKQFDEIVNGLKQLADRGQIEKAVILDLVKNSKQLYQQENFSKYVENEIKGYPQGDLLSFPGDIMGDLKAFTTLFQGPGDFYGTEMVRILQFLIGRYKLSDADRFEFLEQATALFDKELGKQHPDIHKSLHFATSLDEFLRETILPAKPTPGLTQFLEKRMVAVEQKKNIAGLHGASFPMQKLIYLYSIGSGEPPWTLQHVLFGRDKDNTGKVFITYQQGFDPFEYEYGSSDYVDEDRGRLYTVSKEKKVPARRIDAHPLFGANFSADDLYALYQALTHIPEQKGPRSVPRIRDFEPMKSTYAGISTVDTWEEYVVVIGIENFLRRQGIDTTNIGMRPRVFDPGEYEKVPSYYKAFTGELFEVPGLEEIGFFDVRSPARMAERHRTYHHVPTRPQALLRQYFNDGSIDQMFEKVFGFTERLPGSLEEKLSYIVRQLPPSVFRNFALHKLLLDEIQNVLRNGSGRYKLDMARALEPGYLKDLIQAAFTAEQQTELLKLAEEILPHTIWDKKLDAANRRGMISIATEAMGGKLRMTTNRRMAEESQRKREESTSSQKEETVYVYIPADFNSSGFTPYQYYVPGGVEASIEFIVPEMLGGTLETLVGDPSTTLSEKMKHIEALYPRPSPVRDQHLDNLLESSSLSPEEIKSFAALFANPSLAEKHALRALELERDLSAEQFADPEYELQRILYYFPDFSYMRDDILMNYIDNQVSHPEQLRKVQSLLLQFQDNVRQEDARNRIFGHDIIQTIFGDYSFNAEMKKDFLLWIMGFSDVKPEVLTVLEDYYHVSFDSMRSAGVKDSKYYRDIGRGAFEDTLSIFLFGEKGVLSDPKTQREFLNGIFDAVVPSGGDRDRMSLLREIYLSVFENATEIRKDQILKQLFVAMKKLSAEKKLSPEEREGKAIRAFLESLGFIGVKLGQFLESANLDLPPHVAAELAKLKEQASSLSKGTLFGALEIAFGNFSDNFQSLDERLGSASIKMVYKATLKNGRTVVIKVKRPDVEKRIEEELALLSRVLSAVNGHLKRRGIRLPANMIPNIRQMIHEELDFNRELANQKALRANVAARGSTVEPTGIWSFVSRFLKPRTFSVYIPNSSEVRNNLVMVEEFVDGVSLSKEDAIRDMGFDPAQVKEAAAEELLEEIFIDGQFHGDPHAGNIFVDKNGRISLIDTGLMGNLSTDERQILLKLVLYAYRDQVSEFTKGVPFLGGQLGIPSDRDVIDLLKRLSPSAPLKVDVSMVEQAVSGSPTAVGRLLNLLNLVEASSGRLPDQFGTLTKALGTGGYLFEHLTFTGISRVVMRVFSNRGPSSPKTNNHGAAMHLASEAIFGPKGEFASTLAGVMQKAENMEAFGTVKAQIENFAMAGIARGLPEFKNVATVNVIAGSIRKRGDGRVTGDRSVLKRGQIGHWYEDVDSNGKRVITVVVRTRLDGRTMNWAGMHELFHALLEPTMAQTKAQKWWARIPIIGPILFDFFIGDRPVIRYTANARVAIQAAALAGVQKAAVETRAARAIAAIKALNPDTLNLLLAHFTNRETIKEADSFRAVLTAA